MVRINTPRKLPAHKLFGVILHLTNQKRVQCYVVKSHRLFWNQVSSEVCSLHGLPFFKCMIDISPFQQRLEWLKEWIADRLDGRILPPIWINLDALPFDFSIDQVIRIWNQTGVMIWKGKDNVGPPTIPISFEEYCKYKTTTQP